MKYISEFRNRRVATALAAELAAETDPAREYSFMEFCGGHTHAIVGNLRLCSPHPWRCSAVQFLLPAKLSFSTCAFICRCFVFF